MGLLQGKKGLIVGVANAHSIAWGIAQQAHAHGAELAFTYLNEALEKRVRPLAESVGAKLILPCDVNRDEDIEKLFTTVGESWGKLDFLVHCIAFADRKSGFGDGIPNFNFAGFTGFGGQGSTAENAHAAQPFVNTDFHSDSF